MADKELFINSVKQIQIAESSIIPTVLYYSSSGPIVGRDAFDACEEETLLREDFKVELGSNDPGKLSQLKASSEGRRSIIGIRRQADFDCSSVWRFIKHSVAPTSYPTRPNCRVT